MISNSIITAIKYFVSQFSSSFGSILAINLFGSKFFVRTDISWVFWFKCLFWYDRYVPYIFFFTYVFSTTCHYHGWFSFFYFLKGSCSRLACTLMFFMNAIINYGVLLFLLHAIWLIILFSENNTFVFGILHHLF